jgi:hypothetical protein
MVNTHTKACAAWFPVCGTVQRGFRPRTEAASAPAAMALREPHTAQPLTATQPNAAPSSSSAASSPDVHACRQHTTRPHDPRTRPQRSSLNLTPDNVADCSGQCCVLRAPRCGARCHASLCMHTANASTLVHADNHAARLRALKWYGVLR